MHDVGKPRTRRFSSDGTVTFHHHDVVGAKLTRKRMQALQFSGDDIDAVAKLVELHLRFHGYGAGQWTDSAVRRYVRDAGDQLERLHVLTRADCTTRNQRKAERLRRTYDDLEERIARLSEEEELAVDAARPRRHPDHGDPRASRPGRRSARPTASCSTCASTTARRRTTRRRRRCSPGGPSATELRATAASYRRHALLDRQGDDHRCRRPRRRRRSSARPGREPRRGPAGRPVDGHPGAWWHHRRALVVQRTGWGKSAVYFVSTLLLRAAGAGPTVIVSPLLALMRNQIAAAERAGIHAVTINSTNVEEWEPIQEAVAAGEVDVLLVSPERLNNPGFRDQVLPRLAATCGLLVVDEAHCISDWGHDFRPDYRRIRTLLQELPAGIPVLATTATANARVSADVAEQLVLRSERGERLEGLGTSGRHGDELGPEVLVLRGSLDRESLRLGVVRLPSPEQRLGWLADHLAEQPGSGIVYCLTVAATQEIADYLRSRGHHVAAYSGQTDPTERLALEQQLASGEIKALVATSALGMGFDATLGFVVNLGAPPSPVAYYQQVGRAGRGTDRASVVLLPQPEDRDIWAYFASLAFPREDQVRHTLRVLTEEGGSLSTAALETYVDLGRTRLEQMLKVLDVDGAVRRVRGGWVATGEPWTYDADRYTRVSEARKREQQAMLDYLDTARCRMWFLRDQLDDPAVSADSRCGRCDRCGGFDLPNEVSDDAVGEARARLARPGVVIEPRTMWPTALGNLGIDLKGTHRRRGRAGEGGGPAHRPRARADLA